MVAEKKGGNKTSESEEEKSVKGFGV